MRSEVLWGISQKRKPAESCWEVVRSKDMFFATMPAAVPEIGQVDDGTVGHLGNVGLIRSFQVCDWDFMFIDFAAHEG